MQYTGYLAMRVGQFCLQKILEGGNNLTHHQVRFQAPAEMVLKVRSMEGVKKTRLI